MIGTIYNKKINKEIKIELLAYKILKKILTIMSNLMNFSE